MNDIDVSVAIRGKAKAVTLVPEGKSLKFQQKAGRVTFTVPELIGHRMVEIAY